MTSATRASIDDQVLEIHNLRLLGWNDLGGSETGGRLGEGVAMQMVGGRRIAYLATESGSIGLNVVDVTDPREPRLIGQLPAENDHVRFNCVALSGTTLVVARQTQKVGQQPAGLAVYDASDPEHLKQLSLFDTSGPYSRGCHFVWFVDGRYAHLSTGMPDFQPSHPSDDQLYVIVDLADPEHPVEAGRWWLPGMRLGEQPLPRHPRFDHANRLHNVNVLPSHPDRAYAGWIDSGTVILDISDPTRPELVSQWNPHPPQTGFTHSCVPLFERGLMVMSQEEHWADNRDYPKFTWVVSMEVERNLVPLGVALVSNEQEYLARGGRFGPHNLFENYEQPTCAHLVNTTLGTYFNGGLRVFDIHNPYRIEELAYFVPQKPAGSRMPTAQINDVFVDDRKVIYAMERFAGGLYTLEYTGPGELD